MPSNPKNKRKSPSASGVKSQESPTLVGNGDTSTHARVKGSLPLLSGNTKRAAREIDRMCHNAKFRARRLGRYCEWCWLEFGVDGDDSKKYQKTTHCERCEKERITGKVEINPDGGLVVHKRGQEFVPWYVIGDGGSIGGKRWD